MGAGTGAAVFHVSSGPSRQRDQLLEEENSLSAYPSCSIAVPLLEASTVPSLLARRRTGDWGLFLSLYASLTLLLATKLELYVGATSTCVLHPRS